MKNNITCHHIALSVFALAIFAWSPNLNLVAQQTHHKSPAVPSTSLTIGYQGKSLTLSPAEVTAMPHTYVTVFNAHSKMNETYSGVPLAELLTKLDVPQGEKVRGTFFMLGVIAEGTDGYKVLYSLAETDPAIHTGQVLVTDALDGKPPASDGTFKLVSTEEKRPARWVRNLSKISVIAVTP